MTQEERDICGGEITLNECLSALKAMPNEKSPGLDGFKCKFYKFFWKDVSKFLHQAILEAYQCGELSITQKEGLITCIPKPQKDRALIKNWRPITLLNIDYRILSSTLANRFKKVLPTIISDTQEGLS